MHKNKLMVNGGRMVVYKMQNIVDKKEKKYYYVYDRYRKKNVYALHTRHAPSDNNIRKRREIMI